MSLLVILTLLLPPLWHLLLCCRSRHLNRRTMLLRCFFSLLRLLLHRRCFPATLSCVPPPLTSRCGSLVLDLCPRVIASKILLFPVWTESQFDFYHSAHALTLHSPSHLRLGTARTSSLGSLLGWNLRHSHNRWSTLSSLAPIAVDTSTSNPCRIACQCSIPTSLLLPMSPLAAPPFFSLSTFRSLLVQSSTVSSRPRPIAGSLVTS